MHIVSVVPEFASSGLYGKVTLSAMHTSLDDSPTWKVQQDFSLFERVPPLGTIFERFYSLLSCFCCTDFYVCAQSVTTCKLCVNLVTVLRANSNGLPV